MTIAPLADLHIVEMEIREAASLLPPDVGLDFRPFFGGLGGWARGHFFAFARIKEGLYLKLAPEDHPDLLAAAGLSRGKTHELGRQYLLVPSNVLADPPALRDWVEHSVMYAITLPLPKQKRKR